MCVCVRVRECVCVRETESVSECETESVSVCECVYFCVCKERLCVYQRERENMWVCSVGVSVSIKEI